MRRSLLVAVLGAALLAGWCLRTGAQANPPPAPAPPSLASHPRLLIAPDVRKRLAAKAAARDPDWLSVLADADRLTRAAVADYDRNATPPNTIAYAYQGFGWYGAIVPLGLAYNVTGKKLYAAKVVEILRKVNATAAGRNVAPIAVDKGFPSRSAALGVALAFDWVYPELDAKDRAATVATLNQWFDWYRAEANDRDGPVTSNYFGGHLLGFGAAGYATAGDNPRAPEMIARTAGDFDRLVTPAFTNGPFSGGFPLEGYVYGTNHYARLFQYMMLVATATRAPSTPALTDHARRLATNLLHAVKPNGWQVPDEADYPGDDTGILQSGLPLVLSAVAPDPVRANVQHLLTHMGTPPEGVNRDPNTVERLLYWDNTRPAADPAGSEPLSYYSPGDEHLFVRSSWANDAVWASFNGGLAILSDHQARAAGHLAIQRGNDYLLVHAGQWKGKNGVSGQPQQFQTTSAYANTLFVSDGGEYLYNGERYLGGQSPFLADVRPLPHAQSADSTWAKLDATPIYDRKGGSDDPRARSLQHFVRNFVYFQPGTFVLFDRVQMAKPSYVKHLRFHLNGLGTVKMSRNLATSQLGSSALHVRALFPRAPVLRVEWNENQGTKLNPRLEVTSSTPGTSLDALHVLSAVDRQAPAPAAELVTADGGSMLGAHVRTTPNERVALFATAVSERLPASSTVRYRVFPGGPGRHHLFDLQPRQAFRVRTQKSPGAGNALSVTVAPDGAGLAVTSDDVGALVFEVIAGKPRAVAR